MTVIAWVLIGLGVLGIGKSVYQSGTIKQPWTNGEAAFHAIVWAALLVASIIVGIGWGWLLFMGVEVLLSIYMTQISPVLFGPGEAAFNVLFNVIFIILVIALLL